MQRRRFLETTSLAYLAGATGLSCAGTQAPHIRRRESLDKHDQLEVLRTERALSEANVLDTKLKGKIEKFKHTLEEADAAITEKDAEKAKTILERAKQEHDDTVKYMRGLLGTLRMEPGFLDKAYKSNNPITPNRYKTAWIANFLSPEDNQRWAELRIAAEQHSSNLKTAKVTFQALPGRIKTLAEKPETPAENLAIEEATSKFLGYVEGLEQGWTSILEHASKTRLHMLEGKAINTDLLYQMQKEVEAERRHLEQVKVEFNNTMRRSFGRDWKNRHLPLNRDLRKKIAQAADYDSYRNNSKREQLENLAERVIDLINAIMSYQYGGRPSPSRRTRTW